MAKKTNIGLVDAQPKSINQKNLDKLIDKSAFKLSIANSYVSNVGNEENFNPTTVRKTSEPYDSDTGIISDSPEIILFSNFEPTYSDNGQLNKTGEILQAKQESVLVSAVSSIEQLKKSNVFSFIQEKTDRKSVV